MHRVADAHIACLFALQLHLLFPTRKVASGYSKKREKGAMQAFILLAIGFLAMPFFHAALLLSLSHTHALFSSFFSSFSFPWVITSFGAN